MVGSRLDLPARDGDPIGIGNGKTWNHTGAPRGGALVTASSWALPCSCCDDDTGAVDATPSCIVGDRRGRRDETRSGLLSASVLYRRIFASTELVKNRAAILIRRFVIEESGDSRHRVSGLPSPGARSRCRPNQTRRWQPHGWGTVVREVHGSQCSGSHILRSLAPFVKRYHAPVARQGVAVDDQHFYAIGNAHIVKYEKHTGTRVAEWKGEPGGPIVHLNSCIVAESSLVCAHSKYPGVPMLSSIEVRDPLTLHHSASRSLGIHEGSLTWAIPKNGEWWLNFAHCGHASGKPGRGPEWTSLVCFDLRRERRSQPPTIRRPPTPDQITLDTAASGGHN
jgi:hypothetical protein